MPSPKPIPAPLRTIAPARPHPAAPAALKTITMGDLLSHPFPTRDHLLSPWLRQGESVLLWAPTGLGKTMLSLTLALAVAGGGSFLGWTAGQPRQVLLVDGEMHAADLRDRLAMLAGTVEGLDRKAAAANLHILSRHFLGADTCFPDIAERDAPAVGDREAGQRIIMREVRRHGAELVILDNLSTLAELADENDAAAVSPVLSFLLDLKSAGAACLLVHHSGKSGASFRGSSKLATTFEVVIGLHPQEDHAVGQGAAFELRWGKYRGAPSPATRDMAVRLAAGPKGARWHSGPAESAELANVVEAVRSCRHATQREIATALGMSHAGLSRAKAKAIRAGLITEAEWKDCLDMASEADAGESAF